jgi:mRNA interferase YafQ
MTRTIERSSEFRRDYKREAKGKYRASIAGNLSAVLQALATDVPLAARHRDHVLVGGWNGYRECHIKPDLLLIYRKVGPDALQLARLGSHSELFG